MTVVAVGAIVTDCYPCHAMARLNKPPCHAMQQPSAAMTLKVHSGNVVWRNDVYPADLMCGVSHHSNYLFVLSTWDGWDPLGQIPILILILIPPPTKSTVSTPSATARFHQGCNNNNSYRICPQPSVSSSSP